MLGIKMMVSPLFHAIFISHIFFRVYQRVEIVFPVFQFNDPVEFTESGNFKVIKSLAVAKHNAAE